ncbi:MAG: NAD-dependent epimerase/dehydratase family protein, partial [Chloroflexota bacterium]
MARYLITGGAGFLGINMARYLLARGHQVGSLDLVPFDYPDARDKVTAITGDIRDRATVDRAMEGVDVVLHT